MTYYGWLTEGSAFAKSPCWAKGAGTMCWKL